jgi:hypothetical protein
MQGSTKQEVKIWWCNQGRQWGTEYPRGVVCSSAETTQLKFRRMVIEALPGDIVLHHRRGAIVAVSHVLTYPVERRQGGRRGICLYGPGWAFEADYHLLQPPIPVNSLLRNLFDLAIPDGPMQQRRDGLRVRPIYFARFSAEGLRIIYRSARDAGWPDWVAIHLRERRPSLRSTTVVNASINAVEGQATERRIFVRHRDRQLREIALARAAGQCEVCHRDFSAVLRGAGVRALHVHHTKQLADTDVPRLTKLSDLAVVCATCHALIHSNPLKAIPIMRLRTWLLKDGFLTS